jgi:hypothetical protein
MNPDNTNQSQPNDPNVPGGQPMQPMPGAGMPQGQPQPTPGDPGVTPSVPPQPDANAAAQPAPQPAQSQRPPLRIDHNLLAELGLAALPEDEKKALEKHIYETLEMRVGMRLADQMTNEQLDEFETYFNARDDAGAFRWLETNFPNYKDIVAEEFDKLKGEVAAQAPAILAAGQQQVAAAPNPEQPQDFQQPAPQQPMPPTDSSMSGPAMQPPQPPQWPTPPTPPASPSDPQTPQSPNQ